MSSTTPKPKDVINYPMGEDDFSPIFTDQQATDAQAAIDKMTDWRTKNPGSPQSPFDAAGLTDDQKDAFKAYEEQLKYLGDTPDASFLQPTKYDDTGQYAPPPSKTPPTANLPKPINGGSAHNGQLNVNTEALKQFSQNLETLRGNFKTAKDAIKGVVVKPGQFAAAAKISQTINGSGGPVEMSGDMTKVDGLRGDVYKFLDNADKAFLDLQTDIANLITQYSSVEELNNANAIQLTGAFTDAVTQMGTGA